MSVPGCLAVLLLVHRLYVWTARSRNRLPYPPGPRGLLILGNISLPEEPTSITYCAWSKTYSTSIYSYFDDFQLTTLIQSLTYSD